MDIFYLNLAVPHLSISKLEVILSCLPGEFDDRLMFVKYLNGIVMSVRENFIKKLGHTLNNEDKTKY